MTNHSEAAAGAAPANLARTRSALRAAEKCLVLFGAASGTVLATVAIVTITHGPASTFMWLRATILLLATPLFHRQAVRAAQGVRQSFERLRTLALVLPIAIIVVDLIPGVCPEWYAAMQAVSAVPLIVVAIITRRRHLTVAFADERVAA